MGGSHPRFVRPVAAALVAVGIWGAAAPYAGPVLGLVVPVDPVLEVVDHVAPGVVVVAVGGFALARGRLPLSAALGAFLAGFWMFGTHVPLLSLVGRGGVDTAGALWHAAPGAAVLVVAAGAVATAWVHRPPRS